MDYENIVEYVEENEIDIGIICTTMDAAQEVADKLCFAGVKGLWNFAPVDIETPGHVAIENVHLSGQSVFPCLPYERMGRRSIG